MVAKPRLKGFVRDSDHDFALGLDTSLTSQARARTDVEDPVQAFFLEFLGFGEVLGTVFNPNVTRCASANPAAMGANRSAGNIGSLE